LSEIKSKFARSVGLGEHAMVVCDNDRERDLLAIQFLQMEVERDDFVIVFEGNRKHFLSLVRKRHELLKALKSGRMVFLNKKQIFEMEDSAAGFSKRLMELISNSKKSGRRLSFLGFIPPPTYDKIGLQHGIEKILDNCNSTPPPIILCIYSKEGLASLNLNDLLLIYNSHDSMLLKNEILRRSKVN